MDTFLLLLFIFFFVLPVVRLAYAMYKVRKQVRDTMNGMYNAQQKRDAANQQQQRKAGWSTPDARAKKIGEDVGDYVAFEELPTDSASAKTESGRVNSNIATESQIIDADWEDVK